MRHFFEKKTTKWIDILPDLEISYNNSIHSAHGMTPNEVTKENQGDVWLRLYGKDLFKRPNPPKFKVSDRVRLSHVKLLFEKSSTRNWTNEEFEIYKVQKTNPVTYLVKDLLGEEVQGAFYEPELQLVYSK